MLLDYSRNLKIADFGVARVEAQNPKDMTGETGMLGYMAPEVLDGKPYNRNFAEVSSAVVRQGKALADDDDDFNVGDPSDESTESDDLSAMPHVSHGGPRIRG
ncbi:hypothetical protein POM88_037642 [Heracleum sosnowskyi]|uniref:Protein kinase domain-containing protein n=1 Tax=Heracleum sosnowskyi TaxID=360622 RepID=A0AAD8MDH3_9APIA|nr:hypothetical protein POM88_037642 [Heracleum sosnowskyi]